MERERMKEVLSMIQSDMERDAREIDGKPFTGRTVATHFGYVCAAVKALAQILDELLEKEQ